MRQSTSEVCSYPGEHGTIVEGKFTMGISQAACKKVGSYFLVVVMLSIRLQAQESSLMTQYPAGISPSGLSSSQISLYEQQARQRGYSQQQIDAAKSRYGSGSHSSSQYLLQNKTPGTADKNYIEMLYSDSIITESDSADTTDTTGQSTAEADTARLPYFGYSLFRNTPEAFKPNAIGPIDPGYLVGPGDVLRLSVWGQVEFQYELTVNKEGKIFIPVAGQVHVTGIPFEQLQEKVKNLLSRHYSGLATNPPRTFMDLTAAQLRPVRIFIMGEVASPGGYTVSSFATAFNALYSIGGPLEKGSLRNIKVLRNGNELTTVDIYEYLLAGKCTTDVRLQNNDVVFVPRRGRTVAITGSVFKPAYYELKDNENLQSLLSFCGGVPPSTNINRSEVHRVSPFDQRNGEQAVVRIVDLDLKRYLQSKEDFVLYDHDSLSVTPLYYDLSNFVRLTGAVNYPGTYQSDNLTLRDLIFVHGKPVEELAYMKRADLIRLNEDCVTTRTILIDLNRLKQDQSYNIPLQPGDEVIVYEREVEKPSDLKISIEGEVRNPGIYPMSTNLTVADALLRAGGFTRGAYRKSVDVYRPDQDQSDSLTKVFRIELPDSLNYADEAIRNFKLEDRDRIVVRPDPGFIVDNYVTLKGQVKLQGLYALSKRGERLSEIIDRAGGLLPEAFLDGATVTRGGKRLVVNFRDAYYNNKTKENILLQKGDLIEIPRRPNTVYIHGNVNNPGLFSYVNSTRVKDYIDRAGGLADSSHFILVTSPGGETRKLKRSGFANPQVEEGSEILVTRKPPRNPEDANKGPSVTEVIRDTLAIVTSAVTVLALVIKLK